MIDSFCDAAGVNCMACESCICDIPTKQEDGFTTLIKRLDAIQKSASKDPVKIIIRGLPGSGKSTLAHYLSGKYHICICENDHSHMQGLKYNYYHAMHQVLLDLSNEKFESILRSDIIFCDVFPNIEVETSNTLIVVTMIISRDQSLACNTHHVLTSDIDDMCSCWKPIEGELLIDSIAFKEHFKLGV